MRVLAVPLAILVVAVPLAAGAQDAAPPAPPAPPPVQWKAQAKAGLVSTSGNAETTTLTAAANVARSDAANKVALEGVVAYGQSGLLVASDTNGDGLIERGEFHRSTQTTVNNWNVKGRYDRFITKHQGAFVGASVGADEIAGKTLIAGGQAGYAVKLLKSDVQELVGELGYDFSYEEYQARGVKPNEIHSGRAFLGETLKLSATAGIVASVEALANLNTEKNAPNAHAASPTAKVKAFEDIRVNGKIALTAAVRSNVSLSVGFQLRWDRNPAPLPAISGAPPFAPPMPFAKEVDTVTDAALIVTFM